MSNIYTSDDPSSVSSDIENDYLQDILSRSVQVPSHQDEALSEVALSVTWQGSKLGAAYYEFDTEHLYLMPDHCETAPAFTILKLLLKQIEPQFIVTSSKTDERVIKILKDTCTKKTFSNDTPRTSEMQKINLLPNIDFAYGSSRHHIQNLDLPNLSPDISDAERRIFFSSLVDFTNTCMIKATGGLLKFVSKKSLAESLPISAIFSFSLKDIVHVDENTYRDLQIFQDERHPSVYKSSVAIKEGLSLYGICNKCKSSIGKKELKHWLLMPTNDSSIIQNRHTAINFFTLPKNVDMVIALQSNLKHIKYLPKIFVRMKTAQASMNDWKTLYKTSYHAMMIGEICRAHATSLKIFNEISATFSSDLFRVANLLDKVIDFQEYARQNHFAVKPGVDSVIDKMKRLYNGLPDFMTQVAEQELKELPNDIQQCSVIYLPQLGYLLSLPMTESMKETKNYTLPNLRFMFVLSDTVHYKSEKTRKLDSLLGDTLCDIYVMKLSAELDCLIALAVVAKEFNWIQPEMTENGCFEVLKARHPLQELCVSSFVANDIFSGGTESRIKVLTGPNFSGKSTYLKQVALIAFLAHIGSFVPAQKAQIPWLDSIFSCIENIESVSLNLSSFLISLNQLSNCIKYSTFDSLIIMDEFGKHTERMSGLALLTSAIHFWLQSSPACPHVLLATHYLSIVDYIPENPYLSFKTMDMVMNEELVLFYELVDGVAASSYATYTALQVGLPPKVANRSLQVLKDIKLNRHITAQESGFGLEKLTKYFSIYNSFAELNVDSDEDIEYFLMWVKEFSKE